MLGSPTTTVEQAPGRVSLGLATEPPWRVALAWAALVGILSSTVFAGVAEWLFERGWADWLWPLWALSAYISVELPHFGTHLAHPILCLLVGCVAGPVSAVPLLGVSWLASRPVRLVITPRWVELDGVRVELADLSALEVRDDRVVVGSLVSAPLLDPVGARRELVEVRRILPLDAAGSEREARADATRRLARLRGVGAGGG